MTGGKHLYVREDDFKQLSELRDSYNYHNDDSRKKVEIISEALDLWEEEYVNS